MLVLKKAGGPHSHKEAQTSQADSPAYIKPLNSKYISRSILSYLQAVAAIMCQGYVLWLLVIFMGTALIMCLPGSYSWTMKLEVNFSIPCNKCAIDAFSNSKLVPAVPRHAFAAGIEKILYIYDL